MAFKLVYTFVDGSSSANMNDCPSQGYNERSLVKHWIRHGNDALRGALPSPIE